MLVQLHNAEVNRLKKILSLQSGIYNWLLFLELQPQL